MLRMFFVMTTQIKDDHFECLAEGVKPDRKKRILLSKMLEIPGVTLISIKIISVKLSLTHAKPFPLTRPGCCTTRRPSGPWSAAWTSRLKERRRTWDPSLLSPH